MTSCKRLQMLACRPPPPEADSAMRPPGVPCDPQVSSAYGTTNICSRWHSVTQNVDFERHLLLRALLQASEYG
eukprot:6203543-Pleurochrysis_carterae.AAC.2